MSWPIQLIFDKRTDVLVVYIIIVGGILLGIGYVAFRVILWIINIVQGAI